MIVAQQLTKHYRLYDRPIDRLKEAVLRRPHHRLVKALSDIDFEVPAGGTLGLIGENGAGKSTLLKLLAGTTVPSGGHLNKKGRVAALLELGSGFHPEFSGRGNIYLNAALLGLDDRQIKQREDDIIAFSELEEDIDRPVKTYSSGMYMRLAFSIATSVDPDILIIDEALSVGDQYFQQKCIDRIAKFKEQGKTLIFCSHSMYLVNELCEQSLWLHKGKARMKGPSHEVVGQYLAFIERKQKKGASQARHAAPTQSEIPEVLVESVQVLDITQEPIAAAKCHQSVIIRVNTYRPKDAEFKGHLAISIQKPNGDQIFGTISKQELATGIRFEGRQQFDLHIADLPLNAGSYTVSAAVSDLNALGLIAHGKSSEIKIVSSRPEYGYFYIDSEWKLKN